MAICHTISLLCSLQILWLWLSDMLSRSYLMYSFWMLALGEAEIITHVTDFISFLVIPNRFLFLPVLPSTSIWQNNSFANSWLESYAQRASENRARLKPKEHIWTQKRMLVVYPAFYCPKVVFTLDVFRSKKYLLSCCSVIPPNLVEIFVLLCQKPCPLNFSSKVRRMQSSLVGLDSVCWLIRLLGEFHYHSATLRKRPIDKKYRLFQVNINWKWWGITAAVYFWHVGMCV